MQVAVPYRETPTVQSVERAAEILLLLADRRTPTGVRELGRLLDLHPSTVSRLLATLERPGLVTRTPDGEYALGLAAARLGGAVEVDSLLRRVALPYLLELREQTGETANLLLVEGAGARYVEQVESGHALRHAAFLGRRVPLAGTAVGAALADPGIAHAVEDGVEIGVAAVACALPPSVGVEAALSVTGPSSRLVAPLRHTAAVALEAAVAGLAAGLIIKEGTPHVR